MPRSVPPLTALQFTCFPFFPDISTAEVHYDVGVWEETTPGTFVFHVRHGNQASDTATYVLAPGAHDPADVLAALIGVAATQEGLDPSAGDHVFNCLGVKEV